MNKGYENRLQGKIGNIVLILLCAIAFFVLNPISVYAEESDVPVSGVWGGVPWEITAEYELLIGQEGGEYTSDNITNRPKSGYPWDSYRDSITKVTFKGIVHGVGSFSYMFSDCSKMLELDLTGFDTSNVTRMDYPSRGSRQGRRK